MADERLKPIDGVPPTLDVENQIVGLGIQVAEGRLTQTQADELAQSLKAVRPADRRWASGASTLPNG